MVKGFFLHGVDICGDDGAVNKGMQRPFPVLPHAADAPFRRGDPAAMTAQGAPDVPPVEFLIEHGFFDHGSAHAREVERLRR